MLYEQTFNVFNVVKVLTVGAVAFFVAMAFTPLWMKILLKYFRPGKEIAKLGAPVFNALHKKKEGTPTMGGFIIWFTVALLALIFWILSRVGSGWWANLNFLSRSQTLLPLGFLIVAGLVGMGDDLFGIIKRGGLTLRQRLALYTIVAAGGAWWFYLKLGWDFINIPFLGDVFVGAWYIPIFIFIIVATAFSANETDGLDGLSGGVFLFSFGALGAIAFIQQRVDLVVMMAGILGALVAFLWFNIYPARFFMGDTGVMSLGFVLGVVAMLTNTFLLLPVIGVVMLLESASVIVQMISKKIRQKKIFLSTPIHHHFEALGWPETQVTMRFWMLSAIGAILGIIIFLVDSKIPALLFHYLP